MAQIFAQAVGKHLLDLWYHFAIMFEALFILTTLDAGTRVGRYLLQDFLGHIWKPLGDTRSFNSNLVSSVLMVSGWGYFLIQGVRDPLGGVNSLWPLFGIANQLLSVIALCLATTIVIKMGKAKFAWVTLLPMVWLVSVTFTAAAQKMFHSDPRIGFIAMANKLEGDLAAGKVAAGKKLATEILIFNNWLDAVVAGVFLALVLAILTVSIKEWVSLLMKRKPAQLRETAPVWLDPAMANPKSGQPWWRFGTAVLLLGGLIRELTGEAAAARTKLPAEQAYVSTLEHRYNSKTPHRCC
jgi:carbon starvation protein